MRGRLGDNWERISRMSIIEEGYGGEKCADAPITMTFSRVSMQP